MIQQITPGDPRVTGLAEGPELPLKHALAFLAVVLVVWAFATLALRAEIKRRRRCSRSS